MDNIQNKEIADLLFPNVSSDIAAIASAYPPRALSADAKVTRYAPSPTGFLHIGSLFSALVSERVARASGGVFYLRIEDTDKKREVENGAAEQTETLIRFGVQIDEGVLNGTAVGEYGPYVQSERKDIYLSYVKHLLEQGKAYPCFCTSEELEATRAKQEGLKIRPGYYGEWAVHRDDSIGDVRKNLAEGKSFVVRLRSNGNWDNKFKFTDEIKGAVTVTENDQDIVILKSEGLPTYHFAHVVDDHLMGTTHVLRGDEWLSSLPVHLQMFRMLDWPAPKYGHMSPIMKNDAGTKRKLSKRKDPEAAIRYYLTEGYPNDAVIEYLLNIANSDFEDWRKANPDAPHADFVLKLNRLSKSGALFDLNKLIDISKNVISRMSAWQVYDLTLEWARENDSDFAGRLESQKEYFIQIFNIERDGAKPRKDFSKWSEVKESVSYFFDDQFDVASLKDTQAFPAHLERHLVAEVLRAYADRLQGAAFPATRDEWFEDLKKFAIERGFADDMRAYKAEPEKFKGSVADIAMMLRVSLTGRTQTPDLFEMISVMTVERVVRRLRSVADILA